MLVLKFVAAEADNCDEWYFNITSGGLDTGQHPVYLAGMREAEDHLIDNPVSAYGPRDGYQSRVFGIVINKMIFIKSVITLSKNFITSSIN